MRQVQSAKDRNRQPSAVANSESRALVAVQDTAPTRRAPLRTSPARRASAFLAHLALQYDGVSVRRQQRAERLDAAISSYGVEAAQRNARRSMPTRNLKI